MNFNYINIANGWQKLREQFPEAYAFLEHQSLCGELHFFRVENKMHPEFMNDYSRKRLAELEEWAANTIKSGGEV